MRVCLVVSVHTSRATARFRRREEERQTQHAHTQARCVSYMRSERMYDYAFMYHVSCVGVGCGVRLCTQLYTYLHTQIACTYINICTYAYTYTCPYIWAYCRMFGRCTWFDVRTYMHMKTIKHIHTHTYTPTTYTHTHTHTHAHHTHAHACAHKVGYCLVMSVCVRTRPYSRLVVSLGWSNTEPHKLWCLWCW